MSDVTKIILGLLGVTVVGVIVYVAVKPAETTSGTLTPDVPVQQQSTDPVASAIASAFGAATSVVNLVREDRTRAEATAAANRASLAAENTARTQTNRQSLSDAAYAAARARGDIT